MRTVANRKCRGQVLIMVTLASFAVIGMVGLAVDLGWSYFVRRSAQTAADASALAAARAVLETAGLSAPYTAKCGISVACSPTPVNCRASLNLTTGCMYAEENGFASGGAGGRQTVTMASGAEFPPAAAPTAPGVPVHYWVTSRVIERVPQLFSAILGNSQGTVAARATAGITNMPIPGQLYGLNIITDPGPFGTGVDLLLSGGHGQNWIRAAGAIYMASSAHGPGSYAGESNGTGTVEGSAIYIYGDGSVKEPGTYTPTPQNLTEYGPFRDPVEPVTSAVGQPTAPSAANAPLRAVPGGQLAGDCANPPTYPSGTYYATDPRTGFPTGAPINLSACVNLGASAFNDFVFIGGLHLTDTGGQVVVGPGRYFVAGSKPNTEVLYIRNGVNVVDHTPLLNGVPQPPQDLGEIFVLTDQNYPGLPIPSDLKQRLDTLGLGYGRAEIQTGNTENSRVSLHGLTADPVAKLSLPDNLQHFAPIVFYGDQGNSIIDYDNGEIQEPGDPGCTAEPCFSDTAEVSDPMMMLYSSPNFDVYGTVYLPRGASLQFQGAGVIDAPVQFIAGTYGLRGGAQINPRELTLGFAPMGIALIE